MQSVSTVSGPAQRSLVPAAVQSGATLPAARPVVYAKARIARHAALKIAGTVAGRAGKARILARATAAAEPPVVKAPAGETLVLGCAGQLAARVALGLLKAGGRVTAALDDEEEAAVALRFATSLELVSAAEAKALRTTALDPRDPEALEEALPRRGGARVVLVLGDAAGRDRRRADQRVYSAILAALAQVSGRVSQLVLISPAEKATGVFGRSGGAGATRLSALEQQALEGPCPCLLIRTAAVDAGAAGGLVAAGLGDLPAGLSVSAGAVAEAAVAAMALSRGDDAIVEVAASAEAPERTATEVLAPTLAVAEDAVAERTAARAPEPQPQPQPALPSLLGALTGTQKRRAAAAVEVEEAEEEAPAPAKRAAAPPFAFPSFGTQKRAAAAEEEEEEEEDEDEPAPATARKPLFAFGAPRGKPAAVQQEPQQQQRRRQQQQRAQRPAPAARAKAAPAPPQEGTQGRGVFGTLKRGGTQKQEVQPAARKPEAAQKAKAMAPAKKEGGGFLQLLGFSDETVYADE